MPYSTLDRSRYEPANHNRTPERRRWWAHFRLIIRKSDVEPTAHWLSWPSLGIGLAWLIMPGQPFDVRAAGVLSASLGILGLTSLCLPGPRRRIMLGIFGAVGFLLRLHTLNHYLTDVGPKMLTEPALIGGAFWTAMAAAMFGWLLVRSVCGEAYRAGLKKGREHIKLVSATEGNV